MVSVQVPQADGLQDVLLISLHEEAVQALHCPLLHPKEQLCFFTSLVLFEHEFPEQPTVVYSSHTFPSRQDSFPA